MNKRPPNCKAPCADCPFRKDSLVGWLGSGMVEIMSAPSFTCHKKRKMQCAGHMLVSPANQYVVVAELMAVDLELTGRELVFDTPQQCIDHHARK